MNKQFKKKWDFKMFYKGDNDPQIEKDFSIYEKATSSFEKKYKGKTDYLSDSKKLLKALNDYEKLISMSESYKPLHYFQLKEDINSNNKLVQSRVGVYTERFNKNYNKIIFFTLNLGKIEVKKQKEFLKDKILKKYHYFLERIFINSKFELSEKEEKIINLLNSPAYSMWVQGFSKVLSSQEINFRGKNIPINEASGLVSSLETKERRLLGDKLNEKFKSVSDFSEAEINAIVTKKKILDELRGFTKPYQATILSYENDEKVIENLVNVVTNNFKLAHKFYKIKAKILKENKLKYADRGAKIGNFNKSFSLDETINIISSAFSKFGNEYEKVFKEFFENGQIDVYPMKGKKGGAYCWGSYGLPTVILLNHANNFNSVMTLGHEMGHAFHTKLSQTQTPIYSDYTTSVAETASTLFENFVFEEVFDSLSDKEKIIALHDKINGSVSTIFRQIACFNFEKELHETIRKEGYVSKEDIAKLMNKHMKNYLGPVFDLKDNDGYFFVNWSHIRRFFYVYSYAYGALISDALYEEYKKDNKFKAKIEEFLKAGGSKSPENIFENIGINVRDPKFFEKGLKIIENDIKRLEKLVG